MMKILKSLLVTVASALVFIGYGAPVVKAQTPCDLSKAFFAGTMYFTPVAVSPDEPLNVAMSASFSKPADKANCSTDKIYFVVAYTGNVGSVRASVTKEVKVNMTNNAANARTDFQSFRQLSGATLPAGQSGSLTVRLSIVDKNLATSAENFLTEKSTIITTAVTGNDSGGDTGDVNGNNLNPPPGSSGNNTTNSGSADVGKSFYNPITINSIPEFIVRIINILLILTGMLAVLFIIIGGLRYITSSGNPQAATAAKNTIMYAILGLTFAVLSYAIVNVLTNVLINK